jgi:hypothetical protein
MAFPEGICRAVESLAEKSSKLKAMDEEPGCAMASLICLPLPEVTRLRDPILLHRLFLHAATMAGGGQPCASNIPMRRTISSAVCRRYNAVPFIALNVLWHSVHRHRWSLREWIPMLP